VVVKGWAEVGLGEVVVEGVAVEGVEAVVERAGLLLLLGGGGWARRDRGGRLPMGAGLARVGTSGDRLGCYCVGNLFGVVLMSFMSLVLRSAKIVPDLGLEWYGDCGLSGVKSVL
jgi:hypothetical protein